MRAKALTAALASLACLSLPAASAFARPTHTVAHEATRRLVSPPLTAAHERKSPSAPKHAASAKQGAPRHSGGKGSQTFAHPASRRATDVSVGGAHRPLSRRRTGSREEATLPIVPRSTANRVHAWEQSQRDDAAHAAVASANRTPLASPEQDETLVADPATATAPNGVLLADNSDSLLRTSPELPRQKSIEEEAASPVLLPSLYDKRGKLVVPAPLYGSHEVLLHQNQMADRDGLTRVQDDADLLALRRTRKLIALPENDTIHADYRLPENRRFSRPWTAQFLATLARDHFASFHAPLQVNSAVRTVQVQKRLLRTNGNAAPISGETASPHLTGQAVDIQKSGLSLPEIAWMRTYLQPLIDAGEIDVEEEFQQSCFHISVYKSFAARRHVTVAAASLESHPEPY